LFIALKSSAAVDELSLDSAKWAAIHSRYHPDPMCAFVFSPTSEGAYSRVFAPDYGVAVDPGTGSSTGALAFYTRLLHDAPWHDVGKSRFTIRQ